MKKVLFIVAILFVAVFSTACINNVAVEKLNNAAKAYMEKGDYNSAIQRLESSLELDNTVYQTYYNLGVAYVESRQYEKAFAVLENAIRLNPKHADSYYTSAVAHESYADSMVEDKESEETPVLSMNNMNATPKPVDKYKNLPKSTKQDMAKHYNHAKSNYQTYANMVNSPEQSEAINYHINDMDKVLKELGYTEDDY